MSSHFAKPENALRKAEDLCKVGKPSSALKTLHNILTARRYRLFTPTHEQIMLMYITLAVDLRRNVKDALVQYRMICQQAQAASMEKVLRHYQKLTEGKANDAQVKATAAAASASGGKATDAVDLIEDLEEDSPEALIMAAMSGEGTKERLDRQILTPWVKYLWECYRTILDVLRNNAKLEVLYHQTARAAFDFCKRFGRNMEFRRLCEILRTHLIMIAKFQNQTNAVELNSAETQKLYLETRFQQLKMAADLELWQEAYRTIEDIHENMRLAGGRVEPPPELMATYYEKLAQIFLASNNYLFHAYSLHKFYQLSAQDAAATPATAADSAPKLKNLASAVVLSALVISGSNQAADLHDIDTITGVEHQGNVRLAQLLGFKKESPSRQRIIAAIQTSGVLADANETTRTIFRLLETQFGPLSLYAQLKPLFEQLKSDADLNKYLAPLEQLTIIRVLQQLSTVFKSMKIDKFVPLVPSVGSIFALERVIMNGITSDLLNLRFDHRNMTLLFPEADLEQPRMKDQLVHLGKNFISLAHTLEHASITSQQQHDKVKERTHVFKLIQANLLEEHENVFLRQELIEKRKQELEKALAEKERRAAEEKAAARRARDAEEARRLQEELQKREEERRRKEQAERDLRQKQQLAEEMKKKLDAVTASTNLSTHKAEKKIQALTQDLENIDKIQLMRAQEEILRAQQREIERRRKETARRVDYTVRAMRHEERALLLANMNTARDEEKEQFEADFAKYLEADKAAHEKALAEQKRLIARMSKEKNVFHEKLMQRRTEVYQAEKARQDERLAIKAEKRRAAEERRRKEEELRERERAAAEEKARLQREEEERQEALAAEARRKKEEERQEKLRIAREEQEKQNAIVRERQKREEEAEQRDRERRAAATTSRPSEGPRTWARPSAPAGREGGADEAPREEFRRRDDAPRDDFRRRDDAPREDFRRRDDAPFRRDDRDAPRESFRREDRDAAPRREERDAAPRREERDDRDFGSFRNRSAPAPTEDAPRPAAGRWGADRPRNDDFPRRDAPREDFRRREDAPFRRDERDAPRESFRRDERDAPRRDDREAAPRPEREFSREAFGSARQNAPAPRADNDRWQPRGGPRDAPRGDAPARGGDFRRTEQAPAAASSQQDKPKEDNDDGFTTVKGGRR